MKFQNLACTVFDEQTDGQPETNMLPQLQSFEVGGIKDQNVIKPGFHRLRLNYVCIQHFWKVHDRFLCPFKMTLFVAHPTTISV